MPTQRKNSEKAVGPPPMASAVGSVMSGPRASDTTEQKYSYSTSAHPDDPNLVITTRTEVPLESARPNSRSVPAKHTMTYSIAGINLKPLSNPKASCFINTSLQLLCWLVHQGPLKFIKHSWDTIKGHMYLQAVNGKRPFVSLFEKLLFSGNNDHPPSAKEAHEGLCQLVNAANNAGCSHCILRSGCEIQANPNNQPYMDPLDLFLWLYESFLFMAGQYTLHTIVQALI